MCYDCCTQFNNFWKFREQLLQHQNQKIEEINRFYSTTGSQDTQIEPYEVVSLKLIDVPAKKRVSSYKPIIKTEPDGINVDKLTIKKEPAARNKENAKKQVNEASTSQQKKPRQSLLKPRKNPAKRICDYDTDDSFIAEDDADDDDYIEPKKFKIEPKAGSQNSRIKCNVLDSDTDSDSHLQDKFKIVDVKSIVGKKSKYTEPHASGSVVPKRKSAGKQANVIKDGDIVDLTDMWRWVITIISS